MFKILDAMDKARYKPRVYIAATTDRLAGDKVLQHERKWASSSMTARAAAQSDNVQPSSSGSTSGAALCRIPRSREVGQSWLTSALTTALAGARSAQLILRERPDLLLANGPGTCLPLCVLAWALSAVRLLRCKVVFIESIARTERLSMTGQILYRLRATSAFLVQWDQLARRFPGSSCAGRVF